MFLFFFLLLPLVFASRDDAGCGQSDDSSARTTRLPTRSCFRRSPGRDRPTRRSPSRWRRCSKRSAGERSPSSTRAPTTRSTLKYVSVEAVCFIAFSRGSQMSDALTPLTRRLFTSAPCQRPRRLGTTLTMGTILQCPRASNNKHWQHSFSMAALFCTCATVFSAAVRVEPVPCDRKRGLDGTSGRPHSVLVAHLLKGCSSNESSSFDVAALRRLGGTRVDFASLHQCTLLVHLQKCQCIHIHSIHHRQEKRALYRTSFTYLSLVVN